MLALALLVAAAPCAKAAPACAARLDVGETGNALPYYRSHPLDVPDAAVTRAVVVIHGTGRNVQSYFNTVASMAEAEGELSRTVVVAPHFQTDPEKECSGKRDAPKERDLRWSCEGWKDGEAALGDVTDSFAALDALLAALKKSFALERITVAGHSAGAQLVQRYAAANGEERAGRRARVRYLVANPSSYLYLDERRLKRSVGCVGEKHCQLSASSFEVPAGTACSRYNDYKYGMQSRTGYLAAIPRERIKARYLARRIVYLLGELDSAATEEALYEELDKGCAAELQGPAGASFRMQRGLVFQRYVAISFGVSQRLRLVPGCGHSAGCMFRSAEGRKELFADSE